MRANLINKYTKNVRLQSESRDSIPDRSRDYCPNHSVQTRYGWNNSLLSNGCRVHFLLWQRRRSVNLTAHHNLVHRRRLLLNKHRENFTLPHRKSTASQLQKQSVNTRWGNWRVIALYSENHTGHTNLRRGEMKSFVMLKWVVLYHCVCGRYSKYTFYRYTETDYFI
jgi:hypothetical protein